VTFDDSDPDVNVIYSAPPPPGYPKGTPTVNPHDPLHELPEWIQRAAAQLRKAAQPLDDGSPSPYVIVGGLALGALVLFGIVIPVVSGIAHAVKGGTEHAFSWAVGWDLPRVITNPVRHYLDTHTAGLPASPDLLWSAWAITGAVLLVLAIGNSAGARIGWLLYGLATAGMVWAGTAATGRATAAGVTVIAWALCSVLALHGLGRRSSPSVVVLDNRSAE
jgi:uncharacterized membrane protein YedE/YeeE